MKKRVFACLLLLVVGCGDLTNPVVGNVQPWLSLNQSLPTHVPVNAVALGANRETLVYAGTYDTVGLYTSRDGRGNWQPDSAGLPQAPVFSLLAMPAEMFAGTAAGLYRRAYSAQEWQRADPVPQVAIYDLARDSTGTMYVATDARGVWKSEDAGQSWTRVPGLDDLPLIRILVPGGGQTIFAGTAGLGLFVTRDDGTTWSSIPEFENAYIPMLSMDLDQPNTIYVGPRGGVYRSQDGGTHWQVLAGGIEKEVVYAFLAYTDKYNDHWLLAGTAGRGLLKSRDGGKTWTPQTAANTPTPFTAGRAVLTITKQGYQILVGTTDGVLTSDEDRDFWYPAKSDQRSMGVPVIRDFAYRSGVAWAATDDGLYSSAQGAAFQRLDTGTFDSPVTAIALSAGDPFRVYVGTDGKGVFVSDDGAKTWGAATGELGGKTRVAQLEVDPTNPEIVYARVLFERIYKSTDGGDSWRAVWTGMPVEEQIQSMAIAPGDPRTMYAGGDTQFFYSENGGESWQARGLQGISTLALWVNPTDANNVWAGTTDGLYTSKDAGQTWRGPYLQGVTVSAIAREKHAKFFVGTRYNGMYTTDASTQSFGRLGRGFDTQSVNAIALDESRGAIYTATEAGLFCTLFDPDKYSAARFGESC